MSDQLFNRMFLLTQKQNFDLPWEYVKLSDFILYHHPNIEFTHFKTDEVELIILGFLYDYENPGHSNYQILESLSKHLSFNKIIQLLDKYSGQFTLIYKSKSEFFLLNDACAQYEIYYDTTFSSFGSQPKLLEKVIEPEQHQCKDAIDFFSSSNFLTKRVFIGDTTHRANIHHLMPNHCIDVNQKSVTRFFPTLPLKETSVEESAAKASQMLKGYLKAASLRNNLAMAVTGGYDSRILFLASLDIECRYFVSKHKGMTDKHYDIAIPKRLTSICGKEFEVIPDVNENNQKFNSELEQSINFPRHYATVQKEYENHVYINGNISEIARNYYGNFRHIDPSYLSYLNGFANSPFARKVYSNWMASNEKRISDLNYNILDMVYWEDKMGNWGAKAKTEAALNKVIFSPFCSRELLVTLLSTNRKQRDSHKNILYDSMIKMLSPEVSRIPINPCWKQRIITLMKRIRIYNLYRWAEMSIIKILTTI